VPTESSRSPRAECPTQTSGSQSFSSQERCDNASHKWKIAACTFHEATQFRVPASASVANTTNCATNPTEEGIAEIFGFIESLYA
jgi:hypothetical protein